MQSFNRVSNFLIAGDVLWLHQDILNADSRIHKSAQIVTSGGKRPFVVVTVSNGHACLAPLTRSAGNGVRLRIDVSWRRGGDLKWKLGDIYLNDGANTYEGPEVAFRQAYCGNSFHWVKYASITSEGMQQIRREIEWRRPQAG